MTEDDPHKRTIYVGNLPEDVTAQSLYAFFQTFGEIKSVEIPRDTITNTFRGFVFIEFDEREDALAAIDNYDRADFMDRTIKVRKARAIDSKPKYSKAVWANDDWLQNIEKRKIETEKLTRQEEEKSRRLGLPVYKLVEPKQEEKPIVYIEQQN